MPNVKDAMIYNEYHGSDHCPVGLKDWDLVLETKPAQSAHLTFSIGFNILIPSVNLFCTFEISLSP
jgi:hypothetical protein